MISVERGNVLTANSKEYAIKYVADWNTGAMNTAGFQSMANVAVVIKKQPFTTGEAESPIVVFTGFCTPLDPVDANVIQHIKLRSPYEALQTFIADDDGYKRIIVEDLKI